MVLKVTGRSLILFVYGTVTLYGPTFLKDSTKNQIFDSSELIQYSAGPYNPNAT